ncbi:MAG: signal peptidase I [Pseudomonadota bacterium]
MARTKESQAAASGGIGETIKIIVQALLLALVIRTLLFQPFNIPSGSMKPTLLVGDFLFVSKFSYGYSQFSIPFSPPLFDGRIFSDEPERGDVAVFKLPRDNQTDYIKRVVGLPGEEIQMIDGVLHIDGTAVAREDAGSFDDNGQQVRQFKETLPNGVSYMTLDLVENGFADNTPVFEVPENHYFMMGDNRDNSTDSRVPGAVGFVPLENFVGRADVLFFSIEEGTRAWQVWRWPWSIRWGRIFDSVD